MTRRSSATRCELDVTRYLGRYGPAESARRCTSRRFPLPDFRPRRPRGESRCRCSTVSLASANAAKSGSGALSWQLVLTRRPACPLLTVPPPPWTRLGTLREPPACRSRCLPLSRPDWPGTWPGYSSGSRDCSSAYAFRHRSQTNSGLRADAGRWRNSLRPLVATQDAQWHWASLIQRRSHACCEGRPSASDFPVRWGPSFYGRCAGASMAELEQAVPGETPSKESPMRKSNPR